MSASKEWQQQCYGCDIAEFVRSVEQSSTLESSGIAMVLMSILSDVQEEIARGMHEEARQSLNRVKYLISQHPTCESLHSERVRAAMRASR